MEETFNTKAIILDRLKFRESDMKVIIWSEKRGKLELIARGALKIKSKTAGHIELITLSRLMIIKGKRNIDYIGTAIGEDFFSNIKSDLDKITLATRAVKIVKDLSRVEEGEGSEVFSLLNNFLSVIDKKEIKNKELIYNFFILKFLAQIGFEPSLRNCSDCNIKIAERGALFFNLESGGVICEKCRGKEANPNISKISDECVKILRFCLNNNFDTLNSLKVDRKSELEVENKINSFFKYHF